MFLTKWKHFLRIAVIALTFGNFSVIWGLSFMQWIPSKTSFLTTSKHYSITTYQWLLIDMFSNPSRIYAKVIVRTKASYIRCEMDETYRKHPASRIFSICATSKYFRCAIIHNSHHCVFTLLLEWHQRNFCTSFDLIKGALKWLWIWMIIYSKELMTRMMIE